MDDTSGKLLPNKLTVDNWTIDWLRSRLTELEGSLKTTQQNRQSSQFPQENNSDSRYKFFTTDICINANVLLQPSSIFAE